MITTPRLDPGTEVAAFIDDDEAEPVASCGMCRYALSKVATIKGPRLPYAMAVPCGYTPFAYSAQS